MIKGAYDPAIQQKRYAKLYFGLNLTYEEGAYPTNLHSIKIPFMKQDHGIIRFNKITPVETYSGEKIRLDQEIRRMESILVDEKQHYSKTLKMIAESELVILKYISEGPYDSSR